MKARMHSDSRWQLYRLRWISSWVYAAPTTQQVQRGKRTRKIDRRFLVIVHIYSATSH